MSFRPDQQFSHYRLVEKIGEGGMGFVWKALDTRLNRHVAIKFLPQELTSDEERRLRFEREAQAAAALDHPNIAVIHEAGNHQGHPFLVMQLLEGETLRQRIDRGPLNLKEWLRHARAIAEGLAHAHRNGVIHRDLKPENVMVAADGQIKLLDFGLAKLVDIASPGEASQPDTRLATISKELTHAGKVMGTVAYMSPEQAQGKPADHRSDLFSCGVILYEMASGSRPFRGQSDVESLHATIKEDPPSLSLVTGETPGEVERVVRKALEKEVGRRYQDAADLVADLRNLKRDLDSGRTSTVSAVTPAAPSASRRGPRRIVAGGAVVILLIALVWAFTGRGTDPADSPAAPTQAADPVVAIVGFENLNDPADADHLGRMLMGLITTDLVESGGLTVVSMPRVLAARREVAGGEMAAFDASRASQVAESVGANLMMVGQVATLDEGLILTAELIDVPTGRTVDSQRQEAESVSGLFSLAGVIASKARDRIGAGSGAASDAGFDLSRSLTESHEAYRHYVQGEQALHRLDWAAAIGHFQQAVTVDPTFALAYYRQAVAQGWSGDEVSELIALDVGQKYVDRLPRRWQEVFHGYQQYARSDFDGAYETFDGLVRSEVDIPDAYYILGEILTHISRYSDTPRARECFKRALELDPTFKIVLFHLIDAYIFGSDPESARRVLERLGNEQADDPAVVEGYVTILHGEGKIDEAIALGLARVARGGAAQLALRLAAIQLIAGECDGAAASIEASGATQPQSLALLAMVRMCEGRVKAGFDLLNQASLELQGGVSVALAASHSISRAVVLEAAGQFEEARRAFEEAKRLDPEHLPSHYLLGRLYASTDRLADAERELERLREAGRRIRAPWAQFWDSMLTAVIAAESGRPAAARDALRRVDLLEPEFRLRFAELEGRARVFEAAGDFAAAAAAYREALEPQSRAPWGSFVETLTLFRLASVEEQSGELDAAREHYRELLSLWGNADIPMHTVEQARARLAALGP